MMFLDLKLMFPNADICVMDVSCSCQTSGTQGSRSLIEHSSISGQ